MGNYAQSVTRMETYKCGFVCVCVKYGEKYCTYLLPDGIISPHSNPVRDRPILFLLLRELFLDDEGLVRRLDEKQSENKNEKQNKCNEENKKSEEELLDWENDKQILLLKT